MRNCTRLREQTRSWPEQARRRHDCVEQFRRIEIEIEAGGRFIVNSLQSNADCWVRALRLGVDFGTKLDANVVELGGPDDRRVCSCNRRSNRSCACMLPPR
jgi:hypothetical protein